MMSWVAAVAKVAAVAFRLEIIRREREREYGGAAKVVAVAIRLEIIGREKMAEMR